MPKYPPRRSPKLPYSSSWPGGNVFRLYLSLILSPGLFLKTSTKVLFSSLNTSTCSKTWQCDHCCRWWVCVQQDARQDTKLSTRAPSRPPPPPCLRPPGIWDLHSIHFSVFRARQKRSCALVIYMYLSLYREPAKTSRYRRFPRMWTLTRGLDAIAPGWEHLRNIQGTKTRKYWSKAKSE